MLTLEAAFMDWVMLGSCHGTNHCDVHCEQGLVEEPLSRRSSSQVELMPHTVRYMPAGQRTPPVTPRRQRLRSASEGAAQL